MLRVLCLMAFVIAAATACGGARGTTTTTPADDTTGGGELGDGGATSCTVTSDCPFGHGCRDGQCVGAECHEASADGTVAARPCPDGRTCEFEDEGAAQAGDGVCHDDTGDIAADGGPSLEEGHVDCSRIADPAYRAEVEAAGIDPDSIECDEECDGCEE